MWFCMPCLVGFISPTYLLFFGKKECKIKFNRLCITAFYDNCHLKLFNVQEKALKDNWPFIEGLLKTSKNYLENIEKHFYKRLYLKKATSGV